MCTHEEDGQNTLTAEATTRQLTDEVAECPVMPGKFANKARAEAAGLYREYEGNQYWLCCRTCGRMWDDDPAKYATG